MAEPQTNSTEATPAPITRRHVTLVKARNRRISLIVVCLCMIMVLSAGVSTAIYVLGQEPADDGLILDNVIVGGVNIGGMTPTDAENVVRLTVESVITQQELVVRLDYDMLTISPQEIGIQLNVKNLIDAAYSYGRTGSAAQQRLLRAQAREREYHIALLPYLQMDLNAVYHQVQDFCAGYRNNLTQPTILLEGRRPSYGDSNIVHQKLIITMGTPQSNLTADDLYNRILDGYSLMQMELEYTPPVVVEPEIPSAEAIFRQYCTEPRDATIDNKTFAVTPEVYGYGFNIAAVQRRIDRANYGETIEVTLEFMMPDITAEALAGNLFKDTLATYVSKCSDKTDNNRNKNLRLACEAIDGYVIKVGERFDFRAIVGTMSTVQGYASAPAYSGSTISTVGGGVSQVTSVLHYCALLAELRIDERYTHRYAVNYTPLGTDAAIGSEENLVFTNTTTAPIRIVAKAEGDTVTITFLGTKQHSQSTVIEYETRNVFTPHTSYQLMAPDNVYGYKNGDIIQAGLVGYELQMYRCKYDPTTGALLSREELDLITYSSRDEIVVSIGSETSPDGEILPDTDVPG